MELVVSAVTGDLVNRFISCLVTRYSSRACSDQEKQLERLKQLLLRARTVVEEADARHITNSGMLAQLRMLAGAMYRGYSALDMSMYRSLEVEDEEEVSNSSPLKRCCTIDVTTRKHKDRYLEELHGALESLEIAVANMTEFVVILGGYNRVLHRPYDSYLYAEKFMFGRHAEKQEISNFLLQRNVSGAPAVLPIIGARSVGKKTLVAHVCNDERVISQFSSILNLNQDNLLRIADDHQGLMSGRILVVVEFVSDVDEKDWTKFYSFMATMDRGSKVIILSTHKNSEKFGTVRPIFLNVLSYEEFSYLFKTLAFGSANPAEHPRLLRIADIFAKQLQSEWSLVTANMTADVLRQDLDVHFWLCILNKFRRVVERNFSIFNEHPKLLLERGHQIDVADFVLYPFASPLSLTLGTTNNVPGKMEIPNVTFRELLANPSVRPKGDQFSIMKWESRMAPYTTFVHLVSTCAQETPEDTSQLGNKRREVPF